MADALVLDIHERGLSQASVQWSSGSGAVSLRYALNSRELPRNAAEVELDSVGEPCSRAQRPELSGVDALCSRPFNTTSQSAPPAVSEFRR